MSQNSIFDISEEICLTDKFKFQRRNFSGAYQTKFENKRLILKECYCLELKTLIRFPISSSTHYFLMTLLKLSSFALLLQIIFIQSLVHEFTHGTQETGNFQCFFRSTLPPYGEGCVSQFKTAEYVMWKRM